jgi:hypothetical protein
MCRAGCPTKDHESWGACARAAGIQIDRHGLAGHRKVEKDKEHRLDRYASLRKYGLQPKRTEWRHIRDAEERGGVAPTPIGPAPDPSTFKFNREEAA